MLISDEEHAMLQALADAQGLTASDLVRLTIRKLYAELPKPQRKAR